MMLPEMTTDPKFTDDDLGDCAETVERRARVVRGWMGNIVLSDVKNRNQRAFVVETRVRLSQAGDSTTFTERQFYYLRGIYERATGDESGKKY